MAHQRAIYAPKPASIAVMAEKTSAGTLVNREKKVVELSGIEPLTSAVRLQRSPS
jgi:hypothetical protein